MKQPRHIFYIAVLLALCNILCAQDSLFTKSQPVISSDLLWLRAGEGPQCAPHTSVLLVSHEPQVNLNLPVFENHHASPFKKPVLAHEFTLDVYPSIKPKFKPALINKFNWLTE